MATLWADSYYFFKKTSVDLITSTISTTMVERIFGFIQDIMIKDRMFSILGLSPQANNQVVRFLRIILEPGLVLSLLNLGQYFFFGNDGDYTGGIFLTLVTFNRMSDYFHQLNIFLAELSEFVTIEEKTING